MPITKVPEVGKVLVRRAASTAAYPWYEPGGKIVRIAGQRVYYTAADGSEKFTHEYACVCDHQSEADELLEFSDTQRAALTEFMDGIAEADASIQQRLSEGKKPKPGKPGALAAATADRIKAEGAHTRGVRVAPAKPAEPEPKATNRVRRSR